MCHLEFNGYNGKIANGNCVAVMLRDYFNGLIPAAAFGCSGRSAGLEQWRADARMIVQYSVEQ
jgi:hypothetical protein